MIITLKDLIFFLLFAFVIEIFLCSCNSTAPESALDSPAIVPAEMIDVYIRAGSQYVEDVMIKSQDHGIIEIGSLPMTVSVWTGDSITVIFDVFVSNFGSNHPECNCTMIWSEEFSCYRGLRITSGLSEWQVVE